MSLSLTLYVHFDSSKDQASAHNAMCLARSLRCDAKERKDAEGWYTSHSRDR